MFSSMAGIYISIWGCLYFGMYVNVKIMIGYSLQQNRKPYKSTTRKHQFLGNCLVLERYPVMVIPRPVLTEGSQT